MLLRPISLSITAALAGPVVLLAAETPYDAAAQKLKKPAAEALDTATLPETVVTTEAPQAYAVEEASTATKTNTRLLETPQAVTVIPRALIQDQGAQKVEDIIRNSAGVNIGGFFGEWDYYRIRGFDVGYTATYLDGLLLDSAPGEEPWALEQVEVVKGPASTLYGQGPLGGLVNLVSKKPKPENFAEVQFSLGSFESYETAIDAGWVANSSNSLYARVVGFYRQADSFVDFASSERIYIAPSLTWEIGPDTKLTLLLSYKVDTDNLAYALPARGTILPNAHGRLPLNRYIGNPELGNGETERTFRLGYQFEHQFNEHLSLRQNFRYYWLYSTSSNLSYPAELLEDDRTLGLAGYANVARYDGFRIDTALDGKFETWGIKHTVTAGVDYRFSQERYDQRDAVDLVYLDIYNPNYGAMPKYVYGPSYLSKDSYDDLGFYFQEQAKFFDQVTLTAGVRYDRSSYDAHPGDYDDEAVTPKVGLTYEFVKGVALYANYSQSYNPQWSSTDALGNPVKPETGENWEAGLKFNLFGGKWTGLISVYDLTRQNVATDNISTPDPTDAIVTGEQRSRGFEFETAARLAPGLDFTAAYSYIDAKITNDNVLPVGSRIVAVPEHSVNAWLKYTIQEGPLKGLGFGVGGRYYTQQVADETYTTKFDLPAYGLIDAAVYYERGPFRAQVNVDNLLDREYFVGSYSDLYVLPGEPLNIKATIGWKF